MVDLKKLLSIRGLSRIGRDIIDGVIEGLSQGLINMGDLRKSVREMLEENTDLKGSELENAINDYMTEIESDLESKGYDVKGTQGTDTGITYDFPEPGVPSETGTKPFDYKPFLIIGLIIIGIIVLPRLLKR